MFTFNHFLIWLIYIGLYGLPGILISTRFKDLGSGERILLGLITAFLLFGTTEMLLGIFLPFSYLLIILAFVITLGVAIYLKKEFVFEFTIHDMLPIVLFLIVILIRMSSFSPIYFELDPYFYLYAAHQLLTTGYVPPHDDTAWYPLVNATHRYGLGLEYQIATWYKLYTIFDKEDEVYLLSAIASYYPPLAAAMMIFGFYLLGFKLIGRRDFAFFIALIPTFLPAFIIKFMAGVFELQPLSFATFSIFLSSFVYGYQLPTYLSAFINITSTATGKVFLLLISVFFIIWHFKEYGKLHKEYKNLLITFIPAVLYVAFYQGDVGILKYLLPIFIPFFVYYSAKVTKKEIAIAGFLILLVVSFFLPVTKDLLSALLRAGFYAGQYNNPLERTIQEQQETGKFIYILGRLGNDNIPFSPIKWLEELAAIILNGGMLLLKSIMKVFFNIDMIYTEKEGAPFILIFVIYVIYTAWKFAKGIEEPELLLFSFTLPLVLFGLMKAKFTIYLAFGIIYMLLILTAKALEISPEKIWPLILAISLLYTDVVSFAPIAYIKTALIPAYSYAPNLYYSKIATLCNAGLPIACKALKPEFMSKIWNQFNPQLCQYIRLYDYLISGKEISPEEANAVSLACNYLPPAWVQALEWMRFNTSQNARFLSWWDYGHWINYFGQRKAVIRNEHKSLKMIMETAHAYIMGNESELGQLMKKYNASHVIFDWEIISGGDSGFGGKFYALNYLACAYENKTDETKEPFNSKCEFENLWETIQESNEPCTVSKSLNITGKVGYIISIKETSLGPMEIKKKKYCIGPYNFLNTTIFALYDLDSKTEPLKLHPAHLIKIASNLYTVLYLQNDYIWFINGSITNSWPFRTTKFYNSTLYKGYIVGNLEGFKKVFDNSAIKIYRLGE